jgi:hypothetical protein
MAVFPGSDNRKETRIGIGAGATYMRALASSTFDQRGVTDHVWSVELVTLSGCGLRHLRLAGSKRLHTYSDFSLWLHGHHHRRDILARDLKFRRKCVSVSFVPHPKQVFTDCQSTEFKLPMDIRVR